MSNEQNNAADTGDPQVSRAYRELARETVPQRLDDAVLDAARRAARPRYARSRAWARPLAWAATIALSVVVVLELTRAPELTDEPAPAAGIAADDATSAETPAGREVLPASTAPELADAPSREADRAEPLPASALRLRQSAAVPAEEQKLEAAVVTAELSKSSASPAASEEFERQDKDLLGRADRMAELRSNNSAPVAASALASEAAGCPEDAMRDPETWLECIEELEGAGLREAADTQRERLRAAFPEFELP